MLLKFDVFSIRWRKNPQIAITDNLNSDWSTSALNIPTTVYY